MIYIWGAGKKSEILCRSIKRYLQQEDSLAICSNIKDICEKESALKESMIIIAADDLENGDVVRTLNGKYDLENVYYLDEADYFIDVMEKFIGKPMLPYVEIHLSDHCNLNCKGCGHLSNIAPVNFADYQKFSMDLFRLKELFSNIRKMRLMGGEPLLNPQLMEFVELARRENSDTDISVVTNGLLLGEKSSYMLKRMAELDVQLDISGYPPTIGRKEEITSLLKQYGIRYQFTDQIEKFMKFRNPDANMNIETAFGRCPIKECTFLREGRMAACSFPILYSQLNTIMNGKFLIDEKNDIIDIYSAENSGWRIVWKLTHAMSSCRYCRTDAIEFFPWKRTTKEEVSCEDWFVEA